MLKSKHEAYRYKEEYSSSEDNDLLPGEVNAKGSKVRRSARIEQDFKRIGVEDEFSDASHYSQAAISSYFPSKKREKKKRRTVEDIDEEGDDCASEVSVPTSMRISAFRSLDDYEAFKRVRRPR